MLTIDDCNSLLEKYAFQGSFHKITLEDVQNLPYTDEFVTVYEDSGYVYMDCYNSFFTGSAIQVNPTTQEIHLDPSSLIIKIGAHKDAMGIIRMEVDMPVWESCGDDLYLYISNDRNRPFYQWYSEFYPLSDLSVVCFNDDTIIPKKIYLKLAEGDYFFDKVYVGSCDNVNNIDAVRAEVLEDENGYYVNAVITDFSLPNFIIYTGNSPEDVRDYYIGKCVRVNKLPIPKVTPLYRGTPQTIQLINNDTEEPITEFQAYYQGRKLKDNIIELPYDAPDVVDITVDLLDPEYPESTVKLKANTEIKLCTSIAQITSAIEQGIQTLQVQTPSGRTQLLVDELTFNNVTFINSKILFKKCILNNVTITQTEGYNEGTVILSQGTVLNDCTIQNLRRLIVDAIEFNNCTLKKINSVENYILHQPGVIQITGTITDCNFNRSIVFSDGDITLLNNTFNRISSKQHFPNFLYLTGDYTVKNNVFTLNGEWEELAFNMCIIKANNDFNPSVFINDNLFDLNIVYEDEPTNTFYYCLVDDDKIYARRLS